MPKFDKDTNPFIGLRSFDLSENFLFFGREKEISSLRQKIAETNIACVIGSSGSGKSSLIMAGLLPSLEKDQLEGTRYLKWEFLKMKPGHHPLKSLQKLLAPKINKGTGDNPNKEEREGQLFSLKNNTLPKLLQSSINKSETNLLLFIDQFEEIFHSHPDIQDQEIHDKEVACFVDCIYNIVENSIKHLYVVLTMRSDFIDSCAMYPGLTDLLNNGAYVVPQMSATEMKRTISGPLELQGTQLSNALLTRIIHDLGDDPHQLPVLQHAMMRTWENWHKIKQNNSNEILPTHYESTGTIKMALSNHAEEVFNGLASEKQKLLAQKIFKSLTGLSSNHQGIRKPNHLADIVAITGYPEEEVIEVIDVFRAEGRCFLTPLYKNQVTHDSIIDITHESLMHIWGRLRRWVNEEKESAALYLKLCRSTDLYQQGKSGVWVNPELQSGLNWLEKTNPNQAWANRYDPGFDRAINFLEYSKEQNDLEFEDKEKKRKKEIRRTRQFTFILGIASLVSILLLVVSLNLQFIAKNNRIELEKEAQNAKEQRKKSDIQSKNALIQEKIAEQLKSIAEEQKHIADAEKKRARDQETLALLQKAKADHLTEVAEEALEKLQDEHNKVKDLVEKEKEAKLAAQNAEKQAKKLQMIAIAKSLAIQSHEMKKGNEKIRQLLALYAYSYNKKYSGNKNDPDVFKALLYANDIEKVYPQHSDRVRCLYIAEDIPGFISGGDDRNVIHYLGNGNAEQARVYRFGKENAGIRSIYMIKDKFLFAGTTSGQLVFWENGNTNEFHIVDNKHSAAILGLFQLKSSSQLISIGAGGSINVWQVDGPGPRHVFRVETGQKITSAYVVKGGHIVFFGTLTGEIYSVDLNQPRNNPTSLFKQGNQVTALCVNQETDKIIIGTSKGELIALEHNNGYHELFRANAHTSGITSIIFTANEQYFASGSFDNTIKIWNLSETLPVPMVIDKIKSWVMDISFNTKTNELYSAHGNANVYSWVIDMDKLKHNICAQNSSVFTPEERKEYIGEHVETIKPCDND